MSAHHERSFQVLNHAWLPGQAMEDVKEELRALKEGGRGDLTEEQYEQRQQVLLMKWYRTTGPAKLEAGIKHIEGLVEQGELPGSPLICPAVGLCAHVYAGASPHQGWGSHQTQAWHQDRCRPPSSDTGNCGHIPLLSDAF